MATLINGDGNQAVYAAQDADLLSGAITNNKTVILDVGEKFSADVLSSSVIEVHDGVILTKEGRRIQLDQNAVDLFEFPAGAQGVVSWYYIGYKLEIDEDSHQICSTFVQKMDSEGDTIPEGSFRDGDQEVYISLYHVQQDTLGVLTPTLVLTENMTMIDVLDNLIGSASDLPDPTKTVTKNIDQINSDFQDSKLTKIVDVTDGVARSWFTIANLIRNALLNTSRERAYNALVIINGRHYDVTCFTSNVMFLTASYSFITGVATDSSAFQIQLQYDNGTVLHETFTSKTSGNTVSIDSASAATHTDSIEVWA
jgi:hypothetical protein